MFREFVVGKQRRKYEFELASLQAWQTVRIGLMVKHTKRHAIMPPFASVISGGESHRIDEHTSPEKARAVLQMIAAAAGTKVRRRKKGG